MSPYALFRRQPVPQQFEQSLRTTTFPAPTRGIIQNENESYMQPGGAIVQDNWAPTMRGVKLRGGFVRWCDLHPGLSVPNAARKPVISAFEYVSGSQERMYAGQVDKLYDVTTGTATLVKSGQTSGNYAAAQMSNASGDWLIAVNDGGDLPLRFNGTSWVTLDGTATPPADGASNITNQPTGGLVYVWKYRNRLFFIGKRSMSAWYLDINSVGGALLEIPLSGAATKGGYLLFGAVYSTDAGDGLDDKCVFCTTLGEVIVFTGTNPGDSANWRQEGRWTLSPPMGMNAHIQIGGDLLVLTTEGIIPLSQALTRDTSQLDLAMVTRTIKPLWRDNVQNKSTYPWTIKKWDEQGGLFVTWPGGDVGDRMCAVSNLVTGAWCRFVGYDAMCFLRKGADLFFGTQDGIIMQGERTGYDDGNHTKKAYVCTLVGGWEMFGAPASQFVWHQARANFHSSAGENFVPQLTATTDYIVALPLPPAPGPDPGLRDVWDQGKWDQAKWDNATTVTIAPVRSTRWVSIGETGYAHAPIVQVTVAQQARPNVELISIAATYEPAGVNV